MEIQETYTCTIPALGLRPQKSITFRKPTDAEIAILLGEQFRDSLSQEDLIIKLLNQIYVEGDVKALNNYTLFAIISTWAVEQKLIPVPYEFDQAAQWDVDLDDEVVLVTIIKEEQTIKHKFRKPTPDLMSKFRRLYAQNSTSGLRKLVRESLLEGEIDLKTDFRLTLTLAHALIDAITHVPAQIQEKKVN
jgi:hypothetical protein